MPPFGPPRGPHLQEDVRETTAPVTGEPRLPWRELYEAHAAELVGYLWKLTGDREAASDLMQDTFIAAMRDERALRDPAAVRAWLYRIATRLAYKLLRRARLIAFLPFSGREEAGGDAFDAERHAVRDALARIAPDQAVALVLHHAQGFTRAEIAGLTGHSEETIKSRIARGRRAFLAAYDRAGGDR